MLTPPSYLVQPLVFPGVCLCHTLNLFFCIAFMRLITVLYFQFSFTIRRIHVRGHNMFWAVKRFSPKWLEGKSPADFITEMKRHINDVVSHTNGTWVLQNLNLFTFDASYFNGGGCHPLRYILELPMFLKSILNVSKWME